MAGFEQKPLQLRQEASPKKNTGFEEPFCHERNTTLPHPDADTSENACIEGDNMVRTHSHHHILPFQHHRHRSYEQGEMLSSIYYSITASTSSIKIDNTNPKGKGELDPSSAQMGQRN
ncbi:hypothetical protein F5884DRAFT_861267 [Xylogone sp. PMI_703]|nr:hypothetical protein F5884DRAFT_861267 [Xylogone sp. PMI_703]